MRLSKTQVHLRCQGLRNTKGYTLWELMITLAIAGIITTLAVHNLATPSPHRQLREAAQTLRGAFQLARQKAIAEGKEVVFTFDPAQNEYNPPVLGKQTLPPNVQFGLPIGMKTMPKNTTYHLDGVGFSSLINANENENKATFRPNGTISAGNVALSSKNEAIVLVTNVTGRIRQVHWNGQNWEETKITNP